MQAGNFQEVLGFKSANKNDRNAVVFIRLALEAEQTSKHKRIFPQRICDGMTSPAGTTGRLTKEAHQQGYAPVAGYASKNHD
jgi:hypothetical protein